MISDFGFDIGNPKSEIINLKFPLSESASAATTAAAETAAAAGPTTTAATAKAAPA